MHDLISARPLAECDAAAFCSMSEDNRARFKDAGLSSIPTASDEYMQWLSGCASPSPASQTLKLIYGIFVSKNGVERLAGFAGVESLNRFRGAGVWYGLSREFHGKGIAKTGVLSAMADYTERSKRLGLSQPPRWVLHALKRNSSSQNLATSLGFKRDEMLDFTRSSSSRGGQRFDGFMLKRSGTSLREEATARLSALAMGVVIPTQSASNEDQVKPTARRRRA